MQVNVHEAKTQLSKLLQRVENGEEVVIARAGKPIARMVAHSPDVGTRKPGYWRGRVAIHDSFYEDDEELIASFDGADE